ncbi:hypothetical protein O181_005705 [Austropuccinia psidii MF-1]|uniref:Uncharacterized protein n=1 Tax=Austropuccinia psidii MF-1 TaxID=1389203 RepID=A0A9Q3BJH7_9BASI|nr:hypothetical protein [Austropuccinia psidii MF-1]
MSIPTQLGNSSNLTAGALTVLILCGTVGSGKSSFAIALESFENDFIRISQDVLGDRRACEKLARECLAQGKSIIIDRQNFDISQRAHWIKIANEFQDQAQTKIEVDLIEFNTPPDECLRRLDTRTGHESIHSAGEGRAVLKTVLRQWVSPHLSEGFDRHLVAVPNSCWKNQNGIIPIPHPITQEVIHSIMKHLKSIPICTNPGQRPKPPGHNKPKMHMNQCRGGSSFRGKRNSQSGFRNKHQDVDINNGKAGKSINNQYKEGNDKRLGDRTNNQSKGNN